MMIEGAGRHCQGVLTEEKRYGTISFCRKANLECFLPTRAPVSLYASLGLYRRKVLYPRTSKNTTNEYSPVFIARSFEDVRLAVYILSCDLFDITVLQIIEPDEEVV